MCYILWRRVALLGYIDENRVESCCEFKYYDKIDEINEDIKIENKKKNEMINDRREFSDNQRLEYIKKTIWNLLEKPSSSYFARVIN